MTKTAKVKTLKHTKTFKNRKNGKTYTKQQFNSRDGMLTYVWGPPMWHFLHTMSFNYPVCPTQQQKAQYKRFLLSLKYILPCGKCRDNLSNNLKNHPLTAKDLENRHSFSLYIYKLHEVVNTMLHKKSYLSYEDVRERYEHFRARCTYAPKEPEKGCVDPLYGEKSKCLLKIVPLETKCDTLEIDNKCIKHKLYEAK